MTSARAWDKTAADNIRLYAWWKGIECVITFDFCGGYGGTEQFIAVYGSKIPASVVPPKRDGFEFSGYYIQKGGALGGQYYNGNEWDRVRDTVLYAGWIKI